MEIQGSESPASNLSRVPLAQLVQHIGDIIAQGDDASTGTPSQHVDARRRLRNVLVQLMDMVMGNVSGGSKELGAVIQLLKLTMEKVPNWLSGDNAEALLQLSQRFVKMMMSIRTRDDMAEDAYSCMGMIVLKMWDVDALVCEGQVMRMCRSLQETVDAVKDMSLTGNIDATLFTFGGHQPHNGETPVSHVHHGGIKVTVGDCERIIGGILCVLSIVGRALPNIAAMTARYILPLCYELVEWNSTLIGEMCVRFIETCACVGCLSSQDAHIVLLLVDAIMMSPLLLDDTPINAHLEKRILAILYSIWDCIYSTHSVVAKDCRKLKGLLVQIVAKACNGAPTGRNQHAWVHLFTEISILDTGAVLSHPQVFACLVNAKHDTVIDFLRVARLVVEQYDARQNERMLKSSFQHILTSKLNTEDTPGEMRRSKRRKMVKILDLYKLPHAVPPQPGETASLPLRKVMHWIAYAFLTFCDSLRNLEMSSNEFCKMTQTVEAMLLFLSEVSVDICVQEIKNLLQSRESKKIKEPYSGCYVKLGLLALLFSMHEEGSDPMFVQTLEEIREHIDALKQHLNPSSQYYCDLVLFMMSRVDGKCRPSPLPPEPVESVLEAVVTFLPALSLWSSQQSIQSQGRKKVSGSSRFNPMHEIGQSLSDMIKSHPATIPYVLKGLPTAIGGKVDQRTLLQIFKLSVEDHSGSLQLSTERHSELTTHGAKVLLQLLGAMKEAPVKDEYLGLMLKSISQSLVQIPDDSLQEWSEMAQYLISTLRGIKAYRICMQDCLAIFTLPSFLVAAFGGAEMASIEKHSIQKCEYEAIKKYKSFVSLSKEDPGAVEDILQILGLAACTMGSRNAINLCLAIIVFHLESKDVVVSSAAACCLNSISEWRGRPLQDILLKNQPLLERVGPHLPRRPDLLHELAELLRLSERDLINTAIPTLLPTLCAKKKASEIRGVAEQLGTSTDRLLRKYGHYPLASSFMTGVPSMDILMQLIEELTDFEFISWTNAVIPSTMTEMVLQTGADEEWYSAPGVLPQKLLQGISQNISLILTEDVDSESKEEYDLSSRLADGDHVTRMLKELGDELDFLGSRHSSAGSTTIEESQSSLHILRGVIVIIKLTGRYVGRFLPQFLVLLGAAIRAGNPSFLRVQGLIGWGYLVKALAEDAPIQLGGIVNQVVVSLLECLQEGGAVGETACKALGALLEACTRLFPEKLQTLPPIPQSTKDNLTMRNIFENSKNMTLNEKIGSLLEGLRDEALAVRLVSLKELKLLFSCQRQWLTSLASNKEIEESSLLQRLMMALLRSAEPDAASSSSMIAQLTCAECLGMLGAIDPSRFKFKSKPRISRCRTIFNLSYDIMTKHLVKLLKTATSMTYLDLITLAIQDTLRCPLYQEDIKNAGRRASPKVNKVSLFESLPDEMQAIVQPYLGSKYSMTAAGKIPDGVVFSDSISHRRWLGQWLSQLTEVFPDDEASALFKAINPVIRFDVPTATAVAPYIVLCALDRGKEKAQKGVVTEIMAVIECPRPTREGILCLQTVFYLLDTLHWWSEDAKTVLSRSGSSGTPLAESDYFFSKDWHIIMETIDSIPRVKLAEAATSCGAHARALLYYETHLRAVRGGGANIAAFESPIYDDDEVSSLLSIYSRLEEPDGLDGLLKLRQGAQKLEDQQLAAEKHGSWGEALSLYEVSLSQSSQKGNKLREDHLNGYLNCLLQMGHWGGLLNQIEGLLHDDTMEQRQKLHLTAMGSAAAWRSVSCTGEDIKRFLSIPNSQLAKLSPEEMWELRVSSLIVGLMEARENPNCSHLTDEISKARSEVMVQFAAASKESYARAYPHLIRLHMIQEIADAAELIRNRRKIVGPKERHRHLRWDERIMITQETLSSQAPILTLRRRLSSIIGAPEDTGNSLLQYARLCRATGHFDAAVQAVLEASAIEVPGSGLEYVELMHARGENHRALQEIKGIEVMIESEVGEASNFPNKKSRMQYLSQVLLREAQWTAEMGQGTREEIINIFHRAFDTHGSSKSWENGLFQYAVFLDQHMADAKSRQALADADGSVVFDRLGGKARVKMGREIPHFSFLPEVIEAYGQCVIAGSENIYRSLPRMLTLWYEFGALVISTEPSSPERAIGRQINALMREFGRKIPINYWMTSLPQMISRICHRNGDVAELTRQLITDALSIHPQQVLWALASVSKSGHQSRRAAANTILNSAKRRATNEGIRRIFAENSALCEQLYKLCHHQPPANVRVVSARKAFSHLTRVMPLGVIVPTMESLNPFHGQSSTALDSVSADACVTIADIMDDIQIMHSLMKPKRIVFLGSDGMEYPFLAKPKDDLRKDNRMMEAAGVINSLFKDNVEGRRRDLHLRRFAVIPITEDCGLVEWVESTKPVRSCISEVFVDNPSEMKAINQAIKNAYNNASNAFKAGNSRGQELIGWLDNVLQMYPPCFHKWFLRTYSEPANWLNARLSFTKTYAVWCVVGHVVGLGDRHLENVLIDMSRGDAIQIDFGCLFDKGLTLPQPEVVPFRLTQNIIDAFGVAGIEGVYRNSFENTLSVLRSHKENILSIMDTFVHDPLVDWAKSEERRGGSSGDQEPDNPQARDWLATIRGRLQGTLLGVTSKPSMPLSVEGQTQRLILEATSKDKLSRMYIWWQAWY